MRAADRQGLSCNPADRNEPPKGIYHGSWPDHAGFSTIAHLNFSSEVDPFAGKAQGVHPHKIRNNMTTIRTLTDFSLLDTIADLALEAGEAICARNPAHSLTHKKDGSPVTEADQAAETIILGGLARLLPDLPILSEEAASEGIFPQDTAIFALIDPLDGTREWVEGQNGYTVNIGFVAHGRPIAGIVYAPAVNRLWIGAGDRAEAMTIAPGKRVSEAKERHRIKTRKANPEKLVIVASRSHRSAETERYIRQFTGAELHFEGSAIKLCRVAEGVADLYPRFEPTMEWDIAAGHAVLLAAGGSLMTPEGLEFRYGKAEIGFRNGNFIARGR